MMKVVCGADGRNAIGPTLNGDLIFLVRASHHDPECLIRQGPLQRLGLIPRRASFGAGKSAVS